jgi:phosphate acyltransferase
VPDLRPLRRASGDRRLSGPLTAPPAARLGVTPGERLLGAPRIAVDLLGGDAGPEVVVAGAALAARRWPELELLLVGPPEQAAGLLAAEGFDPAEDRLQVVTATQRIEMDEDPVRAVRSRRDSTVRVAARLVRDGLADATVSVGSTGAAMAAALFTLGRLPGVTRPPLAVVVPAPRGQVVLLDAGATVEAAPDVLLQFALAGASYASVRLGVARPSIGLLSNGSEPGKGDPVRKDAGRLLEEQLAGLPLRYAGNVESSAVAVGGVVDVVITDGFTGNVLLKGMEAAVSAVLALAAQELDPAGGEALARVARRLGPDSQGAVLLGVKGVVVVGHASSSPTAVSACIGVAAEAVRDGLVPRLTETMAGLIERRRAGQVPSDAQQRRPA